MSLTISPSEISFLSELRPCSFLTGPSCGLDVPVAVAVGIGVIDLDLFNSGDVGETFLFFRTSGSEAVIVNPRPIPMVDLTSPSDDESEKDRRYLGFACEWTKRENVLEEVEKCEVDMDVDVEGGEEEGVSRNFGGRDSGKGAGRPESI